jgi:amino acid permease
MAYVYQQMPADEPPDNMDSDGSINSQVLPQSDTSFGDGGTKRSLQERQWVIFYRITSSAVTHWSASIHSLSMIALAGMIGTGLFLSSGSALAQSGPLGCLLGFIVVGVRLKSALPTNKLPFRRWALLLLQ